MISDKESLYIQDITGFVACNEGMDILKKRRLFHFPSVVKRLGTFFMFPAFSKAQGSCEVKGMSPGKCVGNQNFKTHS